MSTLDAKVQSATGVTAGFDVDRYRRDFPILGRTVHGRPLVYLDNAATSQKPRQVIDRVAEYYRVENSNVHRGVHTLSQVATDAYEGARETVRSFINAASTKEIIFTRGTTEGINLIASSFGSQHVGQGDEIVVSALEHHSNLVPWHMLCARTKAFLRIVPVSDAGELDLDAYVGLLNARTRLVAFIHTSNALGTINPVAKMIAAAHERGIPVLVDGAQAVPHGHVDVRELDCDFFCFSGHKMFGPTGIGVLYGREELLEGLVPYQGGGEMIDVVSYETSTYADLPHRLEAGTPHIAGAIGLAAAIEYLHGVGLDALAAYESRLLDYATEKVRAIDGVRLIGTADNKAAVLSFLVGDIHPYDVGTILDRLGVAVRTGHHCTMPLMDRLGVPGTVRASFAFYNTPADVDALVEGIVRVKQMLDN